MALDVGDLLGDLLSAGITASARIVRRLFPAAARRRIRLVLFQWLDLRGATSSGIVLQVASFGDWVVFNEIFVSGEYDCAIRRLADTARESSDPIHVLDLGANVGFFTLRAIDRLREVRSTDDLRITAVEADAYCGGEFERRVFAENGFSSNVRLLRGLVGQRRGSAVLYEPYTSNGQSLMVEGRAKSGTRIDYIDLDPHFETVPHIDLLKCDIEGAELLFLQNYPALMRKVRVAVFELHDALCDTAECRRLLREYGFENQDTPRRSESTSICLVWR